MLNIFILMALAAPRERKEKLYWRDISVQIFTTDIKTIASNVLFRLRPSWRRHGHQFSFANKRESKMRSPDFTQLSVSGASFV